VEGRDLHQYKLVRSAQSTAEFAVPVTNADEPGITVSAWFVRAGDLYTGTKYLKVPPEQHQLNVKLATDKPQYLPGQTADTRSTSAAPDGRPVPRAEFSLGVVDEAIYAIHRDTLEDPVTFFFGREGNSVFTDNSLSFFFTAKPASAACNWPQLRAPEPPGAAQTRPHGQPKNPQGFPRYRLLGHRCGSPTPPVTRAPMVEFPDSLTTWRATARGVTPETKVGGRHAQNHRAQEPHPALGGAAILRARR